MVQGTTSQGGVKGRGVAPLPFLMACGKGGSVGRGLEKLPLGPPASLHCEQWTSGRSVSLGLFSQDFYFRTTPFLRPACSVSSASTDTEGLLP